MTVPDRMRAMLLRELGGLDDIELGEMDVPQPAADEVLIRVGTVAVNRQDLNLIFGHFRVPGLELPHVLGLDPAGVVAAVGSDVDDLEPGSRVVVKPPLACTECDACRVGEDDACERVRSVGIHRQGGMAEYVSVPRRSAFALAAGVDLASATAFAHAFPVAATLLDRVGFVASDAVFVSGASGAVGSAVVQLAKLAGAFVVAGVSSEERATWLGRLPSAVAPDAIIDHAVVPDFAATVRGHRPGGIDLYVETASEPAVWSEALGTLARRARVAVIGAHGGPVVEVNNNWLFRQRVSIVGCSGSTAAAFGASLASLAEGRLRPHIDSVVPMADAAVSYARLRSRQNQGKIVLRVADDIE